MVKRGRRKDGSIQIKDYVFPIAGHGNFSQLTGLLNSSGESQTALWAFGKHYFPHLYQSTIAILKDDAQKAALWDDQLEEGSLIVHQTEPDNGVILDYLSLSLASTIAKLKQETLSKQRAKSLSNSEKNAFNGSEHK